MTAVLENEATGVWAEAVLLITRLRERDQDPAYADAPLYDVYARISLNKTKQMVKTDAQILECLRKIEGRHARLGEVLRDDNKSASKLHCLDFCDVCKKRRPNFAKLVARLENRKCQGVVCQDADRLARQPTDMARLLWFADQGFTVASCHGEYDLENPNHRLVLRIKTDIAISEIEAMSRRQKDKMKIMRELGKLGGGPRVFGWPGRDRTRDDGVHVSLLQVELEREAIKTGTQQFLDGTELATIARNWNEAGARTAAGGRHDWQTVRNILLHARNAGLLEHKDVIMGRLVDVDPIITDDQFAQVRATFAARKPEGGRKPSGKHLGSGILRCPHCGSGLRSKLKDKGGIARKYACKCNKVSIDQPHTDDVLRDLTRARLADPAEKARIASRSEAVAKLDQRIEEREQTLLDIGRQLGEEKITYNEWQAIRDPLDRGLSELRAERDALQALGLVQGPSAATLDSLTADWDHGTTEDRRAMLRRAFPLGLLVLPSTKRGFDRDRIQPVSRRA